MSEPRGDDQVKEDESDGALTVEDEDDDPRSLAGDEVDDGDDE